MKDKTAANPSDEVLTSEELANLMKLSTNKIASMANSGELPGIYMGKWIFVKQQILSQLTEMAKNEQGRRQELSKAQANDPNPEKKRRGRPSKKMIDLTKYQDA
ncbi:MAG: hypothetical protein DRQ62_14485 [Gammaproteobacteria bacterium]|nr:MAG: hypothetical protein DRQ62_14485 [Gammaproteobacteria bacterium]